MHNSSGKKDIIMVIITAIIMTTTCKNKVHPVVRS